MSEVNSSVSTYRSDVKATAASSEPVPVGTKEDPSPPVVNGGRSPCITEVHDYR